MSQQVGPIMGIAVRTSRNGPMRQITEARVRRIGGIVDDFGNSVKRGITFISAKQWQEVMDKLQRDLPWHTRRANVLVGADRLGHLIGQTIAFGSVVVQVRDETTPCELMDMLCPGLREALVPDCRGGVFGSVVEEGAFQVGDEITLRQ